MEAKHPDVEFNVQRKNADRNSLQSDVEAFLAEGGEIKEIPRNLRADPPRKPESNYGRGSI